MEAKEAKQIAVNFIINSNNEWINKTLKKVKESAEKGYTSCKLDVDYEDSSHVDVLFSYLISLGYEIDYVNSYIIKW